MNQGSAITAILVFALSVGCGSNATAGTADDEAKEIQRIQQQLKDGSLPEPPGFVLVHMADEKEKAKAMEALWPESPDEPEPWDLAKAVRKAGGLKKFRELMAGLLHSKDAAVRGFAAVWLADLGDPAYAKNLLVLLQSEDLPDAGGNLKNWDREQAAFALGILGLKEHAKLLAGFLRHHDGHLRAGAAAGLARMKAKEYAKEIAALLGDADKRVARTAMATLAELDAKEYAARIGQLLEADDVETPEAALAALATLDAKEQAPRVANLLKNRSWAGRAAIALALLGADKYAQDIAALLNDEAPITQAEALVALGILRASRYAPEVAKHMQHKEGFVRYAAASSIIMMEAEAHATEALRIHTAAPKDTFTYAGSNPMGSATCSIPRNRLQQLDEQFAKSVVRLKATRQ